MRYQVVPLTVWICATAKISYRIVDTHAAQSVNREGVRAWSYDEAVARQICDMLNGESHFTCPVCGVQMGRRDNE